MSIEKISHWITHNKIAKWAIVLLLLVMLPAILISKSCTTENMYAVLYGTNIIFVIQEPTKLYKTTDSKSVITILDKGDKVQAIYFNPGSGGYYKVKLQDGREGYLLPNSHNISVQKDL